MRSHFNLPGQLSAGQSLQAHLQKFERNLLSEGGNSVNYRIFYVDLEVSPYSWLIKDFHELNDAAAIARVNRWLGGSAAIGLGSIIRPKKLVEGYGFWNLRRRLVYKWDD